MKSAMNAKDMMTRSIGFWKCSTFQNLLLFGFDFYFNTGHFIYPVVKLDRCID
jgi:hypothetical protein